MFGRIFPINFLGEREQNTIHIVWVPRQLFATQRLRDKRSDSYTGKHITISAGDAASVRALQPFWVIPHSCP